MSSGSVRRVSRQDIQLVQNLIERCLQLYMSQKEVVETLLAQAKIEPGFTELVWQKLEEENEEFFKAYYARLVLKQQIMQFNKLLDQQVQLMQLHSSTVASLPTSNGSHIPAVSSLPSSNGSHIPAIPENPACYTADRTQTSLKPENMQHHVDSRLSNVFNNGGSSLHTSMHAAVDMSAHGNRINGPSSMLSAQSANMGLIQGINGGGMIKSEPGYSGCSPYMFGTDGNVLETRPTIGGASVTSFTNVESNSHSLNEVVLDPDTSSFGFLGQIPRNFSLSDLTADFSQSSDILETYSRSPFLATDNENFLDRGEQDNNRLDSISEGLSYEDFGSE
ncbi:hypothetical protein AAZX31_19G119100 [Glycine max]|uniref:Angiotensin-converting enzyme 2 n=2 Tax=Glycine subgen. Soja TaxID=1462606 RepID=I1N8U2_SOYBN|nr:uncharacterized protein LOC114400591 isoform X3 [Glycine soja]XP_040868461.1 uncharacterized protein LOC100813964 isoform X3 [Glycine max]XP_040868462.1 uncharacterized protein LOC100813964 isoform X3 [Glycine max]XP_040868463.1 uncharacterized protein LOC100813964 isoform X3 [Glycine max]XP_040868464.1 uncharacterized protein LOC100813964 isoform X3 [Glycine max]KAG4912914.1 hypothetical protein JHK86_053347 [Glycine max]KAG4915862.1 hypothetical protein JHK87_053419 [Glycine soja]KAG508|eukprot:XP_014627534.1 uncharacterized protein LOC100813964 isoform X3 [Glycine max]